MLMKLLVIAVSHEGKLNHFDLKATINTISLELRKTLNESTIIKAAEECHSIT